MTDWDLLARCCGFANEKGLLQGLYFGHELSTAEIATMLHVTRSFVCQRLSHYGIVRRPRGGANNDKSLQRLLWLLDQRDVWEHPKDLSKALGLGLSTIYRLRKENIQ